MQKYEKQMTLAEDITLWMFLVQPFPFPVFGGGVETAHNNAKHRKRRPPLERNVGDTAKKARVADEQALSAFLPL
jgi:hypothetical protein